MAIDAQAHLSLICGLPGSGKTALARSLADADGTVRLCPGEDELVLFDANPAQV